MKIVLTRNGRGAEVEEPEPPAEGADEPDGVGGVPERIEVDCGPVKGWLPATVGRVGGESLYCRVGSEHKDCKLRLIGQDMVWRVPVS